MNRRIPLLSLSSLGALFSLSSCSAPDPIVTTDIFTWRLCSDVSQKEALTPCALNADGKSLGTVEICLADGIEAPATTIPFELRLSSGKWAVGADATNPTLFKGDLGRGGCLRPAFQTTTTPGLVRIDATALSFTDTKYATIAEVPIDFDFRLCSDVSDKEALTPCDPRANGRSSMTVEVCLPEALPTEEQPSAVELRLSAGKWVTGADPANPALLKVQVPRDKCVYPAFQTTTTPGAVRVDATFRGVTKSSHATIAEVPVDFTLRLCSEPPGAGEPLPICDLVADGQSSATVELCLPDDLPTDKLSTPVELRLSAGSWVASGDPVMPSLLKTDLHLGGCVYPAFKMTTSTTPVRIDATVLGRTISKYAGINPTPVEYVALTSAPGKLTPDKSTELQLAAEVRSKANGKPTDGTLVTFSATVEPAGTALSFLPSKVYLSNPTTRAETKLFVGAGATSVTITAKATPPPKVDGTVVPGAEDALTLQASP
ncbi:hypothetical protein [Polyangium sp. 6x1]|uniref:hypothetical protein n=1 Tax=Polyangium sp. 6x1 TaxID=3042689 RepID=UPI002482B761|nr:hypothetical protein [Polyangium sp. 6x1]MDI1442477.1 hypothetical protein [Polyangium sp. 6x1]